MNSTDGFALELDPDGEGFLEFPIDLDSFLSVSVLQEGEVDEWAPPNTMELDEEGLAALPWLLDQGSVKKEHPGYTLESFGAFCTAEFQ